MTHSVIFVIQGIAERSSAIQKISCPCTAYLAKPNSHLHIAAASSWDRDNVDVAYAQRSVVKSNYFRWRCVIHTFITATANQYEVAWLGGLPGGGCRTMMAEYLVHLDILNSMRSQVVLHFLGVLGFIVNRRVWAWTGIYALQYSREGEGWGSWG